VAADLKTRIESAGTIAELEALKDACAHLGDQEIANVYVARKKALKGAK
jgi:hypothetical protein